MRVEKRGVEKRGVEMGGVEKRGEEMRGVKKRGVEKRGVKRRAEEWRGDNAEGANRVTAVIQSHIPFTSTALHSIEATPHPAQADSAGRKVTHAQVCTVQQTHTS